MKKLLSIIIAAMMVVLMLPIVEAGATENPKITVATVVGEKGSEVSVTLSIENNPKLGALAFGIVYDSDKISMVKDIESEVVYEEGVLGGSWMVGDDGASWNNAKGSSANGVILTLKFKVADDVDAGLISIALNEMEAVKSDDSEATVTVVNGGITIEGDDDEGTAAFTVEKVQAKAGEEVVLNVSVDHSIKLGGVKFSIDFDDDKLEFIGYEDSGLTGWTVSGYTGCETSLKEGAKPTANWSNGAGTTEKGTILKLKFKVAEDAVDGLLAVTLSDFDVIDYDEKTVSASVEAGGVTVKNRFPGNVDGDDKLDSLDLIRLSKYLSNMDVTVVEENADVTGDGKISMADLLRLCKYFANVEGTVLK